MTLWKEESILNSPEYHNIGTLYFITDEEADKIIEDNRNIFYDEWNEYIEDFTDYDE